MAVSAGVFAANDATVEQLAAVLIAAGHSVIVRETVDDTDAARYLADWVADAEIELVVTIANSSTRAALSPLITRPLLGVGDMPDTDAGHCETTLVLLVPNPGELDEILPLLTLELGPRPAKTAPPKVRIPTAKPVAPSAAKHPRPKIRESSPPKVKIEIPPSAPKPQAAKAPAKPAPPSFHTKTPPPPPPRLKTAPPVNVSSVAIGIDDLEELAPDDAAASMTASVDDLDDVTELAEDAAMSLRTAPNASNPKTGTPPMGMPVTRPPPAPRPPPPPTKIKTQPMGVPITKPAEPAKLEPPKVGVAKAAPVVQVSKLEPSRVEPAKLEPVKVAKKVDAAKVDAAKVDAAKVMPVVESAKVDASRVGVAKVMPAAETAKAEAGNVEAAKVAKVDAAKVDAAKVDAANIEPAKPIAPAVPMPVVAEVSMFETTGAESPTIARLPTVPSSRKPLVVLAAIGAIALLAFIGFKITRPPSRSSRPDTAQARAVEGVDPSSDESSSDQPSSDDSNGATTTEAQPASSSSTATSAPTTTTTKPTTTTTTTKPTATATTTTTKPTATATTTTTKPTTTKPTTITTSTTKPTTATPSTPMATTEPGCDQATCVLDNFAKACCARYKPRAAGAVPYELERSAIPGGMSRVKAAVIKCGEKITAKGIVKLAITVGGDGRVKDISVSETPDAALGECVAAAARKATFPASQEGGAFSYPFKF